MDRTWMDCMDGMSGGGICQNEVGKAKAEMKDE
jgi:hypothetical protein